MDTKPKFLAIFSDGWNGSSPFAYTLQRLEKYAHFGYTKNPYYLVLANNAKDIYAEKLHRKHLKILEKLLAGTWENFGYNHGHFMNYSVDLEPLKDFPTHHLEQLITLPYTYDKFFQFYLSLHDHVKQKGYKAVASFIPNPISSDFYTKLQNIFDVKCIVLTRDTIRKSISRQLFYRKSGEITKFDSIRDDTIRFDQAKINFPNTHVVVMEELWEGNGKKALSEFLEHPIDNLWPNLYSPDIGYHLKWDLKTHYCPTPCQTIGQSDFIITPQYYNELKDKYSYVYDKWIERLGFLPLHWGEPIDYNKNLEVYPYYSLKYKYPL